MDSGKEALLKEESKTRNDHTGKRLVSAPPTDTYRSNYDKIEWKQLNNG